MIWRRSIQIICPVRQATLMTKETLDAYVEKLESQGHTVYYPLRDIEQDEDKIGLDILNAHEIHIWLDPNPENFSEGSRIDVGAALMLLISKPLHSKLELVKFINNQDFEWTDHKSFTNVLKKLHEDYEKFYKGAKDGIKTE